MTVAEFSVAYTRYMDEQGKPTIELPTWCRDSEALQSLYRAMSLTRMYDARAIALQRTGQLGTFGACLGQEAVGAAIGFAMNLDDVLLPTYREAGAQLMRGVRMSELLLYWGGDERGMNYAGPREDFPICVPIGTQTTQAAGVATAIRLRGEQRAVLCTIGDGGSSKGDFYEAMNLAGAWKLPLVFVVVNNGWAISVRREQQTACATLAQKAIAAGFAGEQVDGNDVVALSERLREALSCARAGGGPHLIEALTWRLCDHTTSDDASRYRDAEEVKQRWQADPLRRLRSYMEIEQGWDDAAEQALHAELKQEVDAEVAAYLATDAPASTAMFDHLYADLPEALAAQRAEVAGSPGSDDG